jgi:surface polysaccharide O-acyltransferase-like enzyme
MLKRNYTIDVFRIIGAFCVVALHSPLGTLPNALALSLRLGSRWAVPFFFLVSGYMVVKPDKQEITTTKSVTNLLAIFIVANVIYLLYFWLDNNPATPNALTFTSLLIGQSQHLWFIGSSILGLLLLQYVTSRYASLVVLAVAVATLLFVVAGDGYSKLSGFTVQYEIARYLTSVPFLFAGYLIARHRARLPRLSVGVCVAWVLLGFVLEAGEAVAIYRAAGSSPHNQELLLGTAVAALGIFYLCLMASSETDNQLAENGRVYSLLIYLYHPLLILILFGNVALGNYGNWAYWLSPLVVFFGLLFVLKVLRRGTPRAFAILSGQ